MGAIFLYSFWPSKSKRCHINQDKERKASRNNLVFCFFFFKSLRQKNLFFWIKYFKIFLTNRTLLKNRKIFYSIANTPIICHNSSNFFASLKSVIILPPRTIYISTVSLTYVPYSNVYFNSFPYVRIFLYYLFA